MDIKDLQGKQIAVLGVGQEGEAVARYLIKHGLSPVLFDERSWEEWNEIKKSEIKKLGVNFIFGPDAFLELKGFDVAFRSPGIRIERLKDLRIERLQITSQTKFFFDNCPAKIIGVTGTKGKGTTSSVIYQILQANKTKSYLTGNIGKEQPLDFLDDLAKDDFIVYELSSFQLQDLTKSPYIAVVLMTTSEHLDYHKDNSEYIEAKASITKFQTADDYAIINADYPSSIKIGEQGRGKKVYFKKSDFNLLSKSEIQLKGEHNLENIAAAVAVADILGINDEVVKGAIKSFKGLEHRLELVAEKQGIKFYNDSFSTTPETAIAAIRAFSEPLIVILGGSQKNSDFTELGKVIKDSKNIKGIILIGQEAERIKQAIGMMKTPMLEGAKSMHEIFSQIKQLAAKDDVVLLSPACASFGMFQNYKDRGEQFKKLANSY